MTTKPYKPNVFIPGAPKCATTSLTAWLAEHRNCYVSPKKEPHFFSNFLRNDMTIEEYESLFWDVQSHHRVIIDASTSYLSNEYALQKLLRYNPTAKFILMFRNPIELSYALHGENLYLGRENEPDFEKAWWLQEKRKKGKNIPHSCQNPEMLFYRDQCLLGTSFSKLLKLTNISYVYWIFLEDLRIDARNCYLKVLEFCGLEDDGRVEFPSFNQAKFHRFPRLNQIFRTIGRFRSRIGLPGLGFRKTFNRFSHIEQKRSPLRKEFECVLYESFKEEIDLLASLTGRDLSHWIPDNYKSR